MSRKHFRTRASRAGVMALVMGTFSVLFIGMEVFGLPVALLGALLALGYYTVARGGRREEWGFAGGVLGAFVIVKELLVDPLLDDLFARQIIEINGDPLTVAAVVMVALLVFSLVWVIRAGD